MERTLGFKESGAASIAGIFFSEIENRRSKVAGADFEPVKISRVFFTHPAPVGDDSRAANLEVPAYGDVRRSVCEREVDLKSPIVTLN